MGGEGARFEIIRGTGPEEASVELWDRSLAPSGLAFEAVGKDGAATITGYRVAVPFAELERFLHEARSYLAPEMKGEQQGNAGD